MITVLSMLLAAAPANFPPADIADAQCQAAFASLGNSKDPDVYKSGLLGAVFFMGKLLGRHAPADIEPLLRAVVPGLKNGGLQPALARCSAEMSDAGQLMINIGKSLTADGI